MMKMNGKGNDMRRAVFDIIQPDKEGNLPSKYFDALVMACVFVSVVIAFAQTFELSAFYRKLCGILDVVTVGVFTIEYVLRLWTADFMYPAPSRGRSCLRYVSSPMAIVDLLAILPFYMPFIFPCPLTFLRLLRLTRLVRLGKLSRYTEAFHAIQTIITSRAKELLVSIVTSFVMLIISSLLIYYAEHDAQPDSFNNAFSGMWWAIATLTTIGYGDIYPVTAFGKLIAAFMAFLGIGMIAVPTGILSGAYVEYISANKEKNGDNIKYCPYCGKKLPHD